MRKERKKERHSCTKKLYSYELKLSNKTCLKELSVPNGKPSNSKPLGLNPDPVKTNDAKIVLIPSLVPGFSRAVESGSATAYI